MGPGAEKWDHGECRRATSKENMMGEERQSQRGSRTYSEGSGLSCWRWDFTHKPESPKSSQLSESSDWPRKGLKPGIYIDQNLPLSSAKSLRSAPLWFVKETSVNWLSCGLGS